MHKTFTPISLISTTLIGFSYFSTPANSATLQSSFQKAILNGNNNQVTQINQQSNLNLFYFDVNLASENNQSFILIKSEILEFIDDFEQDILDFEQSITQEAELFGKNNQITQISEQNLFDVFFLDPDLNTEVEKITNSLPDFELSQILRDRFTEIIPDVKQTISQKADILGNNNTVIQNNYQTVINFFAIEINYSQQLDNISINKVDDNFDTSTQFNLKTFLNDLSVNNPFSNLPDNFFQNNDPLILENTNYNINQISSTVPEPSYLVGLIVFGVLGLNLTRK